MMLNFALRGEGAVSAPSSLYVALLTADPTIVGISEEVAAPDYQRKAVAFMPANDGVTMNIGDVDFGTTTSDWGEIGFYAIVDAPIGGNALVYGEFESIVQATVGTPIVLPDKALIVQVG